MLTSAESKFKNNVPIISPTPTPTSQPIHIPSQTLDTPVVSPSPQNPTPPTIPVSYERNSFIIPRQLLQQPAPLPPPTTPLILRLPTHLIPDRASNVTSTDEIDDYIHQYKQQRKNHRRSILKHESAAIKLKVSFSPNVTTHIITPDDPTDPEPDPPDDEHDLANLILTTPLLRRLLLQDSPPPTIPSPFIISETTDTNPKLQRHLPATPTNYGYTVNAKTGSSIPLSDLTVRAHPTIKPNYNRDVKGPERPTILKATHNEYVRLVDTTKTMTFTNHKPSDSKATYLNFVLEKKIDLAGNPITRVRGTGGGDKLVYEFGNTSHVADTMAFKILLNALASEDSHLITSDLKDFFLTAELPETVYLKILWSQIPQETIDLYHLTPNTDSNGAKFIYGELHQALYGLPQANALAAQRLKEELAKHDFYETDIPCLYRHKTRNITFLIHVDDFAIKLSKNPATTIADAKYIKQILKKSGYQGKFNFGGIDFERNIVPREYSLCWCGYTIKHSKITRTVTISMDDYYKKIIAQIPSTVSPCSTPGLPFNIKYGQKEQYVIETPDNITLTPEQKKFLQKFVGEILWYSNAVAHDILTAVSKLSSHQSNPTPQTFPLTVERIQGYLKTYGNHKIQFQASDMVLHIMSDASFDADPQSKSRGGCFLWIGNKKPDLINGPISCHSKLLPGVPQSAAAAEIVQHVESGKHGIYARRILRCMGYTQPPTIILADNLCSIDYAHDNTKGRTLKTLARRTNWLKHVVRQNVYIFRYVSSQNNIADIFTKLLDKKQHDYLCSLFIIRDNMLQIKFKNNN